MARPRSRQYQTPQHETSDGVLFDSPLTHAGTPRKRKYPVNRKPRVIGYKEPYMTKAIKEDMRKEAQIRLNSFAPIHTSIYTQTVANEQRRRNYYIDVWACVDNRIYKISKLVAKVLDMKLVRKKLNFIADNTIMYPMKHELGDIRQKKYLEIEEKLIRDLSMKMFGIDNGYLWQSISELFPFDVLNTKEKKSYKIEKPKTEVSEKNYRLK